MQDLPPTKEISAEETQYQRSMQKLFDQINFHLQQLFRNLSYIYKTHGILYNFSNFHGFMLRIMLPPELLSFIHFWCPNGKFRERALALLQISRSSLQQFPTRKQNNETSEAAKSEQMASKSEDSNISQNQKPIVEQEQNVQKQQQDKNEEQQIYRQISDPVSEGEVRLYEWVIEQAKKGNRLSRLDLIKQAISTGQVSHLSGSSRWCKKFLSRNPELRKYVKKQPQGKQQGKKQKISQLISEIFKRKQNQQFEEAVPSPIAKHQTQQNLYFDAQPSVEPQIEQWKKQVYKKEEPIKRQRQNKNEQNFSMNDESNQQDQKQQLLCQLIDEQERARYERHVRKVAIEKQNSNIVIERNYESDEYLQKLRKNIFELYHNPTIPLADKVNGILQSKMKIIEDEILEEEENLAESDWVDELQNKKYFEREQPANKEEQSQQDVGRIYVENKYLEKMRNSDK